MRKPEDFNEGRTFRKRRACEFLQAGGAKYAVIVFGDAFAAEETAALRAARGGLAHRVIEAALVEEILHRQEITGGMSPDTSKAPVEVGTLSRIRADTSSP